MKASGRRRLRVSVTAGLIAGTVDIGSACVIYHVDPVVILQAVAGGVLGKSSFHGGLESATLGLLLQWGMSILIAFCCVAANEAIGYLKRHWIRAGLLYGVITFFVMNYAVVPLSAVGKVHAFTLRWVAENMLAMLLFGLIITYVDRSSVAGLRATRP